MQIAHQDRLNIGQTGFVGVVRFVAVFIPKDQPFDVGQPFCAALPHGQEQFHRFRSDVAPAGIFGGDERGVVISPGFRAGRDGRLIMQRDVIAGTQFADFPHEPPAALRLRIRNALAVQHGRTGGVAQHGRQIVQHANALRRA